MPTPHQAIETELKLAVEHLRKAMAAALPINADTRHQLAQLVFATGAQLEGWQAAHNNEPNPI